MGARGGSRDVVVQAGDAEVRSVAGGVDAERGGQVAQRLGVVGLEVEHRAAAAGGERAQRREPQREGRRAKTAQE